MASTHQLSMSTKVYGGHLIDVATLAEKLIELPIIVSELLYDDAVARVSELIAEDVYADQCARAQISRPSPYPLDHRLIDGPPYARALDHIVQASEVRHGPRAPLDDFGFTLSMWFYPEDHRTMMLLPRCEHQTIIPAVMTEIGATEFGYWDNTDRLVGTSKSQWDHRGRMWQLALDAQPIRWEHDVRWWTVQLRADQQFRSAVAQRIWSTEEVRLGLACRDDAQTLLVTAPDQAQVSAEHLDRLRVRKSQLAELAELDDPSSHVGPNKELDIEAIIRHSQAEGLIHHGQPWRHLFSQGETD